MNFFLFSQNNNFTLISGNNNEEKQTTTIFCHSREKQSELFFLHFTITDSITFTFTDKKDLYRYIYHTD